MSDEAEVAFREQAEALAEGGVDLFILETFRDLNELLVAIRALRSVSPLPIVAQMTTEEDGHSLDGTPPETFAPALDRAGADVVGVNCSVGPAAMLEAIEAMARCTSAKLVAQPNAGRPRDVDGRNLYLCSPEYMASYARRFIAAGARLVGGCCGTTPDHIRQIAVAVRTVTPDARSRRPAAVEERVAPAPAVSIVEKSALARAFADREFPIIAEVSSPRGVDLAPTLVQASRFRDLGAVAVNVPDYPRSGARASAAALRGARPAAGSRRSAAALLLPRSESRRDAVGPGRRPRDGHPERPAHDRKSRRARELCRCDLGLRRRRHRPHEPGRAPESRSGYWRAIDRRADTVPHRRRRQPVRPGSRTRSGGGSTTRSRRARSSWSRRRCSIVDAFEAVAARLKQTGLPVLAGLAALEGVRHAEFFASEVVGRRVPDALLHRLRAAADEPEEALAITAGIAARLRETADGIQITAVHGSPRTTELVLARVRSMLAGPASPVNADERERKHG